MEIRSSTVTAHCLAGSSCAYHLGLGHSSSCVKVDNALKERDSRGWMCLENKVDHLEQQKTYSDKVFADGPRQHVTTTNVLVRYIVDWRIGEAARRLMRAAHSRLTRDSSILVVCAGEGAEGSTLCNLGYTNVAVSDISEYAVKKAMERDSRLKGLVLNAERMTLDRGAFDVVIVQDGLHHLQSPVQGFTEMLRVASVGVIFIEPHDSLIGNLIGTKWERHNGAVNYVFRWNKKLVRDIVRSYLGPDAVINLSFSFWHHNVLYHKLGKILGEGPVALKGIQFLKWALDNTAGWGGNNFCGLILTR